MTSPAPLTVTERETVERWLRDIEAAQFRQPRDPGIRAEIDACLDTMGDAELVAVLRFVRVEAAKVAA